MPVAPSCGGRALASSKIRPTGALPKESIVPKRQFLRMASSDFLDSRKGCLWKSSLPCIKNRRFRGAVHFGRAVWDERWMQKSPAILTDCRALLRASGIKTVSRNRCFLAAARPWRGAFSCKRKSPAEPAARKRFFCARMFSGCRGQMLRNRGGRKRRAEKSPPADTKAAEGA